MKTGDIPFEEHRVRVYREGSGPPLLLFHGIGPGTSVPANFAPIVPALAERFEVIGVDLVGFGGSSRKAEPPLFDFELWVRQALHVARTIKGGELRVFGHSLGGAIALRVAAQDERVRKVVATASGGGPLKINAALERFWTLPVSREALREAMLAAVFHAPSVTPAVVAERFQTLSQNGVGDYFGQMMAGDKQALLDQCLLTPALLGRIGAQVLLIHGREDRPSPFEETSAYIHRFVPHCSLHIIGQCGHNPIREHSAYVQRLALTHLA